MIVTAPSLVTCQGTANPSAPVPDGAAGSVALLLHSLEGGGAQRRVATLANAFAAAGRQVTLVTLAAGGPVAGLLEPAVRLVTLTTRGPRKGVLTVAHAPALARWLRKARPDVLMSGVTNTHALAILARDLAGTGTPVVLRASRHPHRPAPWRRPLGRLVEPLRRRLAARTYCRADGVVAVSRDVADGLRRLCGAVPEPVVIPNPVIGPDFVATHDPLPGVAVPLVLGIGRLVRQKDFPTLLRAFAIVRAERPARLALLGSGPDAGRLRALARRLGIADDLALPGAVDCVPSWLARAAVLVSASLWEGLPATLIEALAAGCPVVATDCPGGSAEILDGGRLGALVPMRDPAAMAAAIRAALHAPADPAVLRAGAAAYRCGDQPRRYLAVLDRCAAAAVRTPG